MQKIPLDLLQSFLAFNESRNILEASGSLGITQPALSKRLRQLENLLPEPLFTFSGRKKVLTPFGRELDSRVRARLGNLQEVIREAAALHGDPSRASLRIMGRRGVLDRVASRLEFSGSLAFLEASHERTLEALLRREAEIGITHALPASSEIVAKPLFRERFCLTAPNRLLSRCPKWEPSLLRQLLSLPCLAYKAEDELITALCARHSLDRSRIRMVRTTDNYECLARMVEAQRGWAILPAYLAETLTSAWVLPFPAEVLPARRFFVLYRKEFSRLPWFRALVSEIRSCFPEERT